MCGIVWYDHAFKFLVSSWGVAVLLRFRLRFQTRATDQGENDEGGEDLDDDEDDDESSSDEGEDSESDDEHSACCTEFAVN